MSETYRKKLKICTFNVNSIRARKDLVTSWVVRRNNDLDILCFQEIKVVDKGFPYKAFEKYGYTCVVYGQKGYNGVAICSKVHLEDVRKGFEDEYWDQQKRIISAKLGDFNLINIYVPHGDLRGEDKYYYKLKWFDKFTSFLKEEFSPEEKIMVVGDFNVARNDLDVFDVEVTRDCIGTMVEERKAFQDLLDWGFVDSFRRIYPLKRQFTWWDYIGGAIWRDEGMRIDYVLCTKPLVKGVEDVEVDLWARRRRTPKPSDHAPVIATVEV
jgi:exodeoxyribonuclease-3